MAGRTCPVWVGYILANPLRRLFQNPKKILEDYVKPGMTVLDVGCAMGFFSLGMAEMVGSQVRGGEHPKRFDGRTQKIITTFDVYVAARLRMPL